jgi:tetratricopeptide (TPR) repeat protein
VDLEPGSGWGHILAGLAYEMPRRYARAIAAFERAHALKPRFCWPLILRGICRWYLADFRGAVADLSAAARLDAESELPLLFLARAKADLRDDSLIKDLDRARALAPNSGFVLSWRGRAFFVLKKTAESLADLRRSLLLLPDYDRGYSWLGVSYAEQGRWSRALPLLEKAERLNPYYPTTLYPLAQCAMRLGRWGKAERALKAAAEIDRHGIWVEHRISMSHPTAACLRSREELDRFLASRPSASWAWAWRGQTELLLRNYGRALQDLEKALRLDGRDPWAFLWRAETRRRLGFCRSAAEDFRRALLLAPRLSWASAGLGYCALYAGRARQALSELDRSLRLQGHCAAALAWRGEARFRLRDWTAAARDWQAALELHPHQPWIYAWLWKAKARLGDWAGVLAALESLRHRGGQSSDRFWALLSWAYGRLGRSREAEAARVRAVRLNPEALALPRQAGAGEVEALLAREGLRPAPDGARAPSWAALRDRPRREELSDCLLRASAAFEAGDFSGAVEEASAALEEGLDPTSAEGLLLRARAKAGAFRPREAREDLDRLLALYPGVAKLKERDAVAA